VPPGDHFAMAFIIWDVAGSNPPARSGGAVMQRIHVNPHAKLSVDMR
jgi:hypothetical protein